MTELHTERLLLRYWRAADEEPFAALNADPVVMQFMAGCLTRGESDAFVRQARARLPAKIPATALACGRWRCRR